MRRRSFTRIDPADEGKYLGLEKPLAWRLCGTDALRRIASYRHSKGLRLTGAIIANEKGRSLTGPAIAYRLKIMAQKAGVAYDTTLGFDDRAQILEAISEPDIMGMRDAAIMSWWASLRRSEVAALNVGDIGKDKRGRGLIVLVRKSKTDVNGQFVPVPYVRGSNGKPLPTDAARSLNRWLAAYEKLLGRPLTDTDPLFINLMSTQHERLGERGVSDVISRYAEIAGLEAEMGERISSHGFRAGYATEWLTTGRPAEPLAKKQRRSSTQSLYGYYRPADPFEAEFAFTFDAPEDAHAAFQVSVLAPRERKHQLGKDDR